jgi:hypothetical protein
MRGDEDEGVFQILERPRSRHLAALHERIRQRRAAGASSKLAANNQFFRPDATTRS